LKTGAYYPFISHAFKQKIAKIHKKNTRLPGGRLHPARLHFTDRNAFGAHNRAEPHSISFYRFLFTAQCRSL
jgi:hypothetical protein